jgi:hypothetical protein
MALAYSPTLLGIVSPFADHLSLLVTAGRVLHIAKTPTLATNSWQGVQVLQTMGCSTNLSNAFLLRPKRPSSTAAAGIEIKIVGRLIHLS